MGPAAPRRAQRTSPLRSPCGTAAAATAAPPGTRQGRKRRTDGCFVPGKERGQQVDTAGKGLLPEQDADLSTPANGNSTRQLWLCQAPCRAVPAAAAAAVSPDHSLPGRGLSGQGQACSGTHSMLITVSPSAREACQLYPAPLEPGSIAPRQPCRSQPGKRRPPPADPGTAWSGTPRHACASGCCQPFPSHRRALVQAAGLALLGGTSQAGHGPVPQPPQCFLRNSLLPARKPKAGPTESNRRALSRTQQPRGLGRSPAQPCEPPAAGRGTGRRRQPPRCSTALSPRCSTAAASQRSKGQARGGTSPAASMGSAERMTSRTGSRRGCGQGQQGLQDPETLGAASTGRPTAGGVRRHCGPATQAGEPREQGCLSPSQAGGTGGPGWTPGGGKRLTHWGPDY